MVNIVLRNGKVLQYNEGNSIAVENGTIAITKDRKYLVARIPLDIVERAEFEKPCRILKAKPAPKKANY